MATQVAADNLCPGTTTAVFICQWEPTVSPRDHCEYLEKAESLGSVYYLERPQELRSM